MNNVDPALALELDRLAPRGAAAPDWNDVLARSGHGRPPVGGVAAAIVVLVVALLATPALGIRSTVGDLLGIHGGPRAAFIAALTPVAGSGTGTVIAAPAMAFTPVGSQKKLGFSPSLAVTIRFSGLSGPATTGRMPGHIRRSAVYR